MNERQESKLSRFIEKYGITQEEVNSIFAKKQGEKDDDDLLEDNEPTDSKAEEKTDSKEEVKTETKEEVKGKEDDGKEEKTEEIKDVQEDNKEEKVEDKDKEQSQIELLSTEMKSIFNSLGARMDAFEEVINSLRDTEETKEDFGVKGDQQNKGENTSTDTFSSLSKELGAK